MKTFLWIVLGAALLFTIVSGVALWFLWPHPTAVTLLVANIAFLVGGSSLIGSALCNISRREKLGG